MIHEWLEKSWKAIEVVGTLHLITLFSAVTYDPQTEWAVGVIVRTQEGDWDTLFIRAVLYWNI